MSGRLFPWLLVVLLAPFQQALGYGYSQDEDPLLIAFRAAVQAARQGEFEGTREQAKRIRWQIEELNTEEDLRLDFAPTFQEAHEEGSATERGLIHSWSNLIYLALIQKFHWNLKEELADYHKARARLDSAQTYYEIALSGNVKGNDARRRERDPQAPLRHEDVIAQFRVAREALGSPGLFGTGSRAPDLTAFRGATVRIAGHLNAVFPSFARPEAR